jgi:DNA ligase 1
MKTFKPMLAPNETIDIKTLKYPLLASYKLDGIRCIFKDGEMYSRALKQFPNVQLINRFQHLADFSKTENIILDGELLAKSISFNELSGLTRQLDHILPDDLYFYCFDAIADNNFDQPFIERTLNLDDHLFTDVKLIGQRLIDNVDEINKYYEEALDWGCDGLILRDPTGRYKFGRGTVKEGLIYKMKPFMTFDAQIIGIIQATEVREGAEKKINELGRSVTSKKKDDRILIEKASAFVVMYEGKELKITIAMTDEEKEEVWKNQNKYIGRFIEYKGMLVGSKDLPRHPVFLRFRDDK